MSATSATYIFYHPSAQGQLNKASQAIMEAMQAIMEARQAIMEASAASASLAYPMQ
jgi:hypothetical protein